jgi:outer membrane protein TolC
MKLFNRYIIILVMLYSGRLFSQSIFSYDEFITIVKEHHPVSYMADLKTEQGEAYITKYKGGFDPVIYGNANQKYFDKKQYYSYLNGGLKIPTWFGVTIKGGYDMNDGQRLNPESYTVNTGLWNAGIEANLGKGLFIDQRRADVQQSEYMQSTSLQEQKLILNQLILDASIAYYDWYKSNQKVEVYKTALENARMTLKNTIQNAELGDKAFVDTLKASIQVQERLLKLSQSGLELYNKKEMVNTFLWQDKFVPLEIDSAILPENPVQVMPNAPNNMEQLVSNHPEVVIEQNKLSINKIDYRLKKESLKPTVKLKYNALSSDLGQGVVPDYSIENYTWGATVSYPIFTRKERGDLKLYDIKTKEQSAKIADKSASIKYKILTSYQQILSMEEQLEIQVQATLNYQLLYQAEKTLFDTGESSLFLVNTRELNWINAQVKMVELIAIYNYSYSIYKYHLMNY